MFQLPAAPLAIRDYECNSGNLVEYKKPGNLPGFFIQFPTNRPAPLGTYVARFADAFGAVCRSPAEQIISDGEGVQHVIRLRLEEARSREEALQVARTISRSMLVKTAWAGADPNRGRILAAVGRSGIEVDPLRVQIFIRRQKVCRNGVASSFDEKQSHRVLAKPLSDIRLQLGRGRHTVMFLTADLTAEYVRINADYST
jgi:glutamate N-acetyltransferase/amino-acid N-acetyltransferase